jgi:hypothetical protein
MMEFKINSSGECVEFHLHLVRAKNKHRLELANINEITRQSDGKIIRRPIHPYEKTKSQSKKTGSHRFTIKQDGYYEIKLEKTPFIFVKVENKAVTEISEKEAIADARIVEPTAPKQEPKIETKRLNLCKKEGKRSLYTGEFVRTGLKHGYMGDIVTVLLKDVRDESGRIVTDHLWFNMTKGFSQANLKAGDFVEFRGRVERYVKGYKGWRDDVYDGPIEEDYKLSFPTKVRKVVVNHV